MQFDKLLLDVVLILALNCSEWCDGICLQNVLVVEDIIDTGRTMTKLIKLIKTYKPKSVQVARCVAKWGALFKFPLRASFDIFLKLCCDFKQFVTGLLLIVQRGCRLYVLFFFYIRLFPVWGEG